MQNTNDPTNANDSDDKETPAPEIENGTQITGTPGLHDTSPARPSVTMSTRTLRGANGEILQIRHGH